MTASQAVGYIGTGTGYLYVADIYGTLLQGVNNDITGYSAIKKAAVAMSPVAGEIRAVATINITAVAGLGLQLTALTIAGVSQITAAVNMTNLDPVQSASDIATAINAYVPGVGPNYTAQSYGGLVTIMAPSGYGDTLNGDLLVATFDPGVTATTTDVGGGQDNKVVYDLSIGARFYINPSVGASPTSIAGATEVTQYIVNQGLQGALFRTTVNGTTADKITITRQSAITHAVLNTGGAAVTVNEIVGDGFQFGDILILSGRDAASSVNFISASGGTENLWLVSGAPYASDGDQNCLTLRYMNDQSNGVGWYEVCRGRSVPATIAEFRSINIPFSPAGTYLATLNAGGGTITLDEDVDPHNVNVTTAGAVVLAASWVIQAGTNPLSGDTFYVNGQGSQLTLGANTLTVFGKSVPQELATNGRWAVIASYNGAAYESTLIVDYVGADKVLNGAKIVDASVVGTDALVLGSVQGNMAGPGTGQMAVETIAGGIGGDIGASTITEYNIAPATITAASLASSVTSSLGCVSCVKVSISSAQILQLFSTPQTLVPAQGAGTYIVPINVIVFYDYGTVQYTTAGVTGAFVYVNTAVQNKYEDATTWGLANVGDQWTQMTDVITSSTILDFAVANEPLMIKLTGADPLAGDGTMTVWVTYKVLTP